MGHTVPNSTIEIAVRGPFRATGPGAVDLTPRGRRTRGLLALLALAPDHRRERTWIAEHLWSDRAPKQASGSLRQALTEIRRTWGAHASALLGTNSDWIALDRAAVTVGDAGEGLLLEGMGLPDRGFQGWLARIREADRGGAVAAVRPPPPEPPSTPGDPAHVAIRCVPARGSSVAAVLGDAVAHSIGRGISERVRARRFGAAAADAAPIDVEIRCDVIDDSRSLAFILITHPPTGRVLYDRVVSMDRPAAVLMDSDELARAAFEAAETAVDQLPHDLGTERPVARATALGQLGLHRLFSFEADALVSADDCFAEAFEADPNPVFLAWRAFLQVTRSVEFAHLASPDLRSVTEELLQGAAQRPFDNPVVQALVAQCRVQLFGDALGALPTAERAAEISPRNPMALQALAVARMHSGRAESAYAVSLRARSFADRSRFRHWWDLHHCAICIATGRHDEAVASGEAALAAAPTLRPAHRFLLPLYAARGDVEGAERMRLALERIEPGFTLDRMLEDPDYPVRTLRRTGLLQAARRIL